ncbi:MAG: N-acetylneuraminate synthase family protein [Chitinophagales bacterium]|nr:N-acetylneuraminate synthase family protein [Chitinophagales bacterium]
MKEIILSNGKKIGGNHPAFVIAEIGLNHNGDMQICKQLIHKAKEAGADAVKFQKRTPEVCTPRDQWDIVRETPWGTMTYIEYRHRIEFGEEEYAAIDKLCKELDITWFASCWDEESVDFLEQFKPMLYKAASASLTDIELLKKKKNTGKPLIISTGMSSEAEIKSAVSAIGIDNLMIAHATSTYPCKPEELNLNMIHTLESWFPEAIIGYSGHETGLATTLATIALGAKFIERHFTLDRAMWGSDQSASVEPGGFEKMVRDIRDIEVALGDGVKRVYESELGPKKKLRRI